MTTTINNEHKKLNVPNLRFPEFEGEWEKCTFDKIAQYKKGPFGSALKKDIFVPQSKDTIKVYEQQNAIKKDWTLSRYYITKGYFNSHMKQFVAKAGDLIVSCAGTIGEIYELPQDAEEGVFNQALMRVQVNDEAVNKEIFITVFSSMIDKFSKIYSNGSAIKNIPPFADLKKTQVFLPCKEEQKKIAKLLVLLDERIATQNKIIEDLKKLKSAISEKLFKAVKGDVITLSEICEISKGKQINGEFLSEKGKYYVMNGGTEPSGYYNNYNVEANTISISEGGNSCGYVQFNTSPFWSGGHCYTIQEIADNVDNLYLYHFLKSKEDAIMKLRIGSGLPNIQKKDLAMFKIKIPTVEQQKAISTFLSSLERKAEIEERIQNAMQKEKQYLLRQMFI